VFDGEHLQLDTRRASPCPSPRFQFFFLCLGQLQSRFPALLEKRYDQYPGFNFQQLHDQLTEAISSRARTGRKQAASLNPSLDIEEHPPHTPKTLTADRGPAFTRKTNAP
jgi:hypothetical protein